MCAQEHNPVDGSAGIDVSVVIVSFNTRDILRDCLHSVERESASLRVEILIVDNASSDGSPEMVEQEFPQVRLIRSATNLGFGAANNLALREARGRYYVLLNSDAFFQPDSLVRAVEHMDRTPNCAVGGARLVGRDGALQPSARMFHTLFRDFVTVTGLSGRFPKSKFWGSFDRTWADPNEPAEVDWVPGAFWILRPEAVAKVGMFDPAFFLYYEEVDLSRRMKQAGYSVWYWPDIEIVHIGGESSRRLKSLEFSSHAAQVVLWRMRSTLLYYRKHHGMKAWFSKMLETWFYRLVALRNRFAASPDRREKSRQSALMIGLLSQAWQETRGGRISPPRPW